MKIKLTRQRNPFTNDIDRLVVQEDTPDKERFLLMHCLSVFFAGGVTPYNFILRDSALEEARPICAAHGIELEVVE